MYELNVSDIDTLCDALDALESKAMSDHMMGSMMKTVLLGISGNKDDPEFERFRREKEAEMESERIEIESKRRSIKERSVLLKAKLIHLKDQCAVDGLVSAANINESAANSH